MSLYTSVTAYGVYDSDRSVKLEVEPKEKARVYRNARKKAVFVAALVILACAGTLIALSATPEVGGEGLNAAVDPRRLSNAVYTKIGAGICSGTDVEYKKQDLKKTNPSRAWYTHGGLATGICHIRNVAQCAKICHDVAGCKYFSISLTQSCFACFVHKTCDNPSTKIGHGYQIYKMAEPRKFEGLCTIQSNCAGATAGKYWSSNLHDGLRTSWGSAAGFKDYGHTYSWQLETAYHGGKLVTQFKSHCTASTNECKATNGKYFRSDVFEAKGAKWGAKPDTNYGWVIKQVPDGVHHKDVVQILRHCKGPGCGETRQMLHCNSGENGVMSLGGNHNGQYGWKIKCSTNAADQKVRGIRPGDEGFPHSNTFYLTL